MPSQVPSSLDAAAAEHWLSGPRYRRYLKVASGDHDQALQLYVWNSRVAAAGAADVGHLEVALRNAYDRQLARRSSVSTSSTMKANSPPAKINNSSDAGRARRWNRPHHMAIPTSNTRPPKTKPIVARSRSNNCHFHHRAACRRCRSTREPGIMMRVLVSERSKRSRRPLPAGPQPIATTNTSVVTPRDVPGR